MYWWVLQLEVIKEAFCFSIEVVSIYLACFSLCLLIYYWRQNDLSITNITIGEYADKRIHLYISFEGFSVFRFLIWFYILWHMHSIVANWEGNASRAFSIFHSIILINFNQRERIVKHFSTVIVPFNRLYNVKNQHTNHAKRISATTLNITKTIRTKKIFSR